MNKTAIKSFAVQARNKLRDATKYQAGLVGITETGIKDPLPQSGNGVEYYAIGTPDPHAISGVQIKQRRDLVTAIAAKQVGSDYGSAYEQVIDEVAYTWFNRLIAVRFMEVNDYLPSRIRVLSSELAGKMEPDIVTNPFDAQMAYTDAEKAMILQWKDEENLDEVFRYLFLKQCNELNAVLPALFEKESDHTELLLAVSFIDKDGVVYRLVHEIPEEDFNVEIGGQVEIIGWLYQYYNTEPKAKVFSRTSGTKIKKEEIPAATQLFTPDWIVRYMVENSLGRIWIEGHPDTRARFLPTKEEQDAFVDGKRSLDDHKWHYYLEEAGQEPEVQAQLEKIRKEYAALNPEDLRCIDPCMGSGHILCYFFDVLMQIYESQGYTNRDAVQSILEHNIWGLDIDDRAYQLAYFAVMMKARQYDRRILSRGIQPHVHAIVESNGFNKEQLKYFGAEMEEREREDAREQIDRLLEQLYDAKEYGSILSVDEMDWEMLRGFAEHTSVQGQMEMDAIGIDKTQEWLERLVAVGEVLAQKYWIAVTNPPYMSLTNADKLLMKYAEKKYPDEKNDLYSIFIERMNDFIKMNGYRAMITQQSWISLPSFLRLREKTYKTSQFVNFALLGSRAFDEISGEIVSTVIFSLRKNYIVFYRGCYLDLQAENSEEKKRLSYLRNDNLFLAKQDSFQHVPNSVMVFNASENSLKKFDDCLPMQEYLVAKPGMQTSDNERFLRLWSEVNKDKIGYGMSHEEAQNSQYKWFPYNKGMGFRKWYGNNDYVINFYNDGEELKYWLVHNPKDIKTKHWSRNMRNYDFYFKEGITFTAIGSSFSSRLNGVGYLFDTKGPTMFGKELKYMCGFTNSVVFDFYNKMLCKQITKSVSSVNLVPIIIPEQSIKKSIESLIEQCLELSKTDWDSFETSWDFQKHPLLYPISTVARAYTLWTKECENRFINLKFNEEELNRNFIDIYDLQEELTPGVEDKDVTISRADLQRDIKSLISYALGCMFGRYSLDIPGLAYAGGKWDDSKYNTFIPDKDNVLPITDEEYFDDDIVGLFCAWLKKVYGTDTLEENLDFIARALGNKGNSSREIIRNYFLNEFFKDHCSTYSVTGSGKRPIYWLYDSGKQNGFKALVYMHRYDADTTGRVRVDYLHRIEKIYASEISRMEETIQNSKNNREVAAAVKRKEKLKKQQNECREYDEKIAHLALARIEIDLDDGVKINYRKVQTDANGRFYEILADSKAIMAKAK